MEYIFGLYDIDNSKHLDISEALAMIKDLYGNNFESNPDAFK